ncbi:MAG TPA: guanylate kinase [Chloroflexota bacterium]|nr:guanylate kinase [Chloroflexota bacterium]
MSIAGRAQPGGPAESRCRLFVLSGPSGVGKDSVIQRLRHRVENLSIAVTQTTRSPRPGEIPGVSYFFVSRDEYNRMLDAGELLAPAEVHGNWYGAPLDEVRRGFAAGHDVLLKIDVQGAIQVRRRFPQAIFVFLAPPDADVLLQRLRARHTEAPDELDRRLADARFEMEQLPQYDYVVVNREDDLDYAVAGLECIITAERLRTQYQPIELGNR